MPPRGAVLDTQTTTYKLTGAGFILAGQWQKEIYETDEPRGLGAGCTAAIES